MSVLTLNTPQQQHTRLAGTTRSGRTCRLPARFRRSDHADDEEHVEDEDEDGDGDGDEEDEVEAPTRARSRSVSAPRSRASSVTPPGAGSGGASADDERPFQCEHPGCGKAFKKRNKLNRHMLSHTDERKYVCQHPGCDKKFLRSQHLAAHQQTHSGPSSSPMLSAMELDGAAISEAQKQHVCTHPMPTTADSAQSPVPVCGKRFWTKQKLDRHLHTVHEVCPPGEELSLSALEDEEGASGSPLGTSTKKSAKLYPCDQDECSKIFRKRKHLRAHIWDTHSDAPHLSPYTTPSRAIRASVEPGTPAAAAAANNHPERDVRQRPFPCNWPGCTMRFPTNSHRRIHEQRHEEKKQKSYTCALPHPPSSSSEGSAGGMLTFPTWSLLRAHMREVHPPRCPRAECAVDAASGLGRSFRSQEGLKAHLKRHEERDALLEAEEEAEEAEEADGDDEDEDEDEDEEEHDDGDGAQNASGPFYGDPTKTGYRFACTHSSPQPSQQQPTCPKRFKTARALDVHTRVVHLGERRFQCSRGCGRRFGYKCTKERHEAAEKCVLALADDREEEEEEMEDDYFREEGGAVPERDSERVGPSTSRAQPAPAIPAELSILSPPPRALVEAAKQSTNAENQDQKKAKEKKKVAHTGRARGLQAYGVGSSSTGQSSSSRSGQGRSLYDLFTGEGYAPASATVSTAHSSSESAEKKRKRPSKSGEEDGEDADGEEDGEGEGEGRGGGDEMRGSASSPPPSKKRKIRDRIFPCPWHRIVELQRKADAEAEADGGSDDDYGVEEEGERQEPLGPLPDCGFRFSRMYDLRRHVRSRHGVDLTKFDKGAMEVIMQQQ
ncbi:unnamed protein product [Tilletia laevis]|uniref:C2H2-type domain-containing protein n=3 Tax=Tilletia TaxID=13289 RepID=A0A9N8M2R8_9BASI|nr:hypothetical protein CF336_g1687 [Tilletia laevis]KAE8202748.1 hypothetical protein CF335_g3297 [Tilletia laevis]KAE8260790.1 hypothetical protein A4X03_0g3696 [Tilletia caries]CAD6890575.1 unnamed protein product [Tilletia caries]CAD6954024.1 unnamed protein product [Tilletia laevis]